MHEADASSYLVLSNEVAVEISRSDYTLSRIATGKQQHTTRIRKERKEADKQRDTPGRGQCFSERDPATRCVLVVENSFERLWYEGEGVRSKIRELGDKRARVLLTAIVMGVLGLVNSRLRAHATGKG